MSKIINWILSFTKVGRVLAPVQKAIGGYKSYLAGAGLAIPALLTIIQKFGDQGAGYLATVTSSPEWALLLNGLGIMGLRAAISKGGQPTA